MSKKTLLFGAIASILTINSVIANQVITSQTYVDTQDALKQDKITAGTTGNVVLYNGTQNGQTQFSERAIYDGTNEYDSSTDANKLITAGAVDGMVGDVYDYVDDEISNIPAPELPTGTPDYVVTYDENGDIGGERGIYDLTNEYEYGQYDASTDASKLVTASTLHYLPEARVTKKWCYQYTQNMPVTDENCLLWKLVDYPIRAIQCNVDSDCYNLLPGCDYPTGGECYHGMCVCGE